MNRIRTFGARKVLVALLALALTLGVGSTILAQNDAQGHTYYACLKQANGQLYSMQVDDPDLQCHKHDQVISWNETGPPGAAGQPGEPGKDGIDGIDGMDGQDGQPGLIWRGEWDAGTVYASGDAVSYAGSSYIAIAATTGEQPGEGASWDILALAGTQGPAGPQGPAGGSQSNQEVEATIAALENQVGQLQGQVQTLLNQPGIHIDGVTALEGTGDMTAFEFTVQLTGTSSVPVSVEYSTSEGSATAGSDYIAVDDILTFQPGELEKTITVQVIADPDAEMNETFALKLLNPTASFLLTGQAQATILSDDVPEALIGDAHCTFGETCDFAVTLTGQYAEEVVVYYRTLDGRVPVDDYDYGLDRLHYTSTTGSLNFAPGETEATIGIPTNINGDIYDWVSRHFHVELYDAVNATLTFTTSPPIWPPYATGYIS